MHNKNNIDRILEKYFEGETSIDEEKLLCQYFQSNEIEKKHADYAPLFQYFTEEKEVNKSVCQKKKRLNNNLWIAITTCAAILIGILFLSLPQATPEVKSVVYVDGKEINNIAIISSEALNSIINIEEDDDENVLESQIDILDSFTE